MNAPPARLTRIVAELTVTDGRLSLTPVFELDGGRRTWRGNTHQDIATDSDPGVLDLQPLLSSATHDALRDLAEHDLVAEAPPGGPPVSFAPRDAAAATWLARIGEV